MFSARDTENIINAQQQAAVSKPLNQTIRGFGSKTPGNKAPKTPFKVPLNDENAIFRPGKSVLRTNGKGNENVQMGGKKGGDFDKSAFVTPAGPRTRAPLGVKTTNAKAKAFQTPAPLTIDKGPHKSQQKSRSPRLQRPKVKIFQPEPTPLEADDEEPEVEYCPPPEIPLPDYPSDEEWPKDKDFPMFLPENYNRGIFEAYFQLDSDEEEAAARKDAENKAALDAEMDALIMQSYEASMPTWPKPASLSPKDKTAYRPVTAPKDDSKAPPTLTSRTAATALSQLAHKRTPSFAAPTTASKSKLPSLPLPLSRKKTTPAPPSNPSSMRHNAATAASRTTLGYSHGRAASTSLRKPLTGAFAERYKRSASAAGAGNAVHQRKVSSASTITPAKFEARERDMWGLVEDEEEEEWVRNRFAGLDMGRDEDVKVGKGDLNGVLGEEEEFRFEVPRLDE
ncbi:hypothetical protein M501DRAFT_993643 [Patellaria atrata CBS 101060]|uniref:Uncharacterized protein n=1 Tax=Patellaria atrata CBS 101060 TaxID=1346257 RepID=A0A9P4SIC7_9PEZI|nr:hypothetical protein M501DRAFT_993643 [Patellaria atrata CBS 101060]